MTKELTPQFSRKVLLISLIFLLANLGIYGLKYLTIRSVSLESVAPKLVSARIEGVEVKSPYDADYRPAVSGQEILSGTSIRTGMAEFAELTLNANKIRLDEQTEIRLLKNRFSELGGYVPDRPKLEIELLAGSIWVDAFDLIEIKSPRSIARFNHTVAIVTHSAPINRLMVVTGAANLHLLSEQGALINRFVVPLHNQVTFIDSQISDVYASLKPSKLKKELKMTPISKDVLADEWVARNAHDFTASRNLFSEGTIRSSLTYQLRSRYHEVLSAVTFVPEARRNLAMVKAKTMLSYLLGGVQERLDMKEAETIIAAYRKLNAERSGDPALQRLAVETLFAIEYSRCGTPAYLLKEYLVGLVAEREGPHVYNICLTDVRRALFEKDLQASQMVSERWLTEWKAALSEANMDEFERQSQILNHTILSYINLVTPQVLSFFDQSGEMKMAFAKDLEEARFEVISDRLQIAAALTSAYRYPLAKQYLKSSYLSLDIDNLSPELASTQIFLENGKLLAQRIEYAESVLRGAAQPIDETRFREYFQIVMRDKALSDDLRKFFELDREEVIISTPVSAPTAAQVAERFLDVRINVNYSDIRLKPIGGFYYTITNARLIDRGTQNEPLSFSATYDYVTNSVMDVVSDGRTYRGSFTLADIVTALKKGGQLESRIPTPTIEGGIELLITDQEKIAAEEGQAIAQDVARQLAYNQLNAYGIVIPEAKFDIEILDKLNLNHFRIRKALIPRTDGKDAVAVSFEYYSNTRMATKVMGSEGLMLIEETAVEKLPAEVIEKAGQREAELRAIGDFSVFAKLNDLFIDPADIVYTPEGQLQMEDLELLTLGLKVNGIFNPAVNKFTYAAHPLYSAGDMAVKDYFALLVDQHVLSLLNEAGHRITVDQILTNYPFKTIRISKLDIGGLLFDFTLDTVGKRALNITGTGIESPVLELPLSQLSALAAEIRIRLTESGA